MQGFYQLGTWLFSQQHFLALETLFCDENFIFPNTFPIPRIIRSLTRKAQPLVMLFSSTLRYINRAIPFERNLQMTIDQQLCYKRLPNWTAQHFQMTQTHTAGNLEVNDYLYRDLHFYELDEEERRDGEHLYPPRQIPFAEPQAWHRIAAASDDLNAIFLYRKPEDYMAKKYDTKAH